jgi:hypothetical protein
MKEMGESRQFLPFFGIASNQHLKNKPRNIFEL